MKTNDLQRNFEGYLQTPLLWQNTEFYGLQQYFLKPMKVEAFTEEIKRHLRLGKLVERFVFKQLIDNNGCQILAENLQIQDGKRTIGELDALILDESKSIHLEIVYKFYLYDPDENDNELSHWIGPNRKDSLLQKLDKLKEKQLPLLYHPKTESVLKSLDIEAKDIHQQVLFKAQLYLPLNHQGIDFDQLNQDCVKGFYMNLEELHAFENVQFYIPEKINWLMEANDTVHWMNYFDFSKEVTSWLNKKMAPLCWMKAADGTLQKFFVVWW